MRLAIVPTRRRGETDGLLARAAGALARAGLRLAGAVQINADAPGRPRCDMDLRVLPDGPTFRISQALGAAARGCRLDPDGLERAVAATALRLDGAELLIVNKFDKHEAAGRGFAPLIAEALWRDIPVRRDIPVLLGVNALNRQAFDAFSAGCATSLPATLPAILDWAERPPARGAAAHGAGCAPWSDNVAPPAPALAVRSGD